MLAAVSQVCTLGGAFDDDLSGIAEGLGTAVELWLTKLEDHVEKHSLDDVQQRLAETGLKPVAASFQGGLLLSEGEARRESWGLFTRRLDLCATLRIPVLVVVPDFLGPFQTDDIERAQRSLKQAGEVAATRGVKLAVEFQAKGTFLNNLETTAMFIESLDQPNVGLCLDTFHFHVGPSKTEDLGLLSARNLFHVQFSDLADRPRELASDGDRILPGDGDVPLRAIANRLRDIGYAGAVSLELPNPQFWNIPARQVAEVGLTALRLALGQAAQC